jgi:predicted membrane protein
MKERRNRIKLKTVNEYDIKSIEIYTGKHLYLNYTLILNKIMVRDLNYIKLIIILLICCSLVAKTGTNVCNVNIKVSYFPCTFLKTCKIILQVKVRDRNEMYVLGPSVFNVPNQTKISLATFNTDCQYKI